MFQNVFLDRALVVRERNIVFRPVENAVKSGR
jgi:hypothetical protein